MNDIGLQDLCQRGQLELMETRYLDAARTLSLAENQAWRAQDFDTLSRLYLPLQEARRQIRQRCGEGTVQLHLLAKSQGDLIDPPGIVGRYPHGQLLLAGWGTNLPAVELRSIADHRDLYVETFLAAVYPIADSDPVVAILAAPSPISLPIVHSIDQLRALLPINSLLLLQQQIPQDADTGNAATFAGVMALWEQLHIPFLQAAVNEPNPVQRMQAYRLTLQVDPACELAHQFLADIARTLARGGKQL